MKFLPIFLSICYLLSVPAAAQTPGAGSGSDAAPIAKIQPTAPLPIATPLQVSTQEYCVSVMAGFPNEEHLPRYQFFRLSEELARDATPAFKSALAAHGDGNVAVDTSVLDVIEVIANPVLRQAAPELIVSHMSHLINFADRCQPYISGQVKSLAAFDAKLPFGDAVIKEDALFLRQVLSDSLFRLKANSDPLHGRAVTFYANSLVVARDRIEFQTFVADIDEIEALYMTDLDGRLARSNDIINSEMNRETLADAVTLSDDMNQQAKRNADQTRLQTLLRILSRY